MRYRRATLGEDAWPDDSLEAQAGSIGPALLTLIDSERRWVHRRVERVDLLNATQTTRSVATDFSVPVPLCRDVGLLARASDRGVKDPGRFVVPLAVLPKAPLQDFTITPEGVHRLTADQANPLVLAALTPFARMSGADPTMVLSLAREIVRSETPMPALLRRLEGLLSAATGGEVAARKRLRRLVGTFNDNYILLVVAKADPGLPVRINYSSRQDVEARVGTLDDPPLVIEPRLPLASGPGPPYRVEIVAPDGLEIETASIVAVEDTRRRPEESINTKAGGGAFVQLRAPDSAARPQIAGLQVSFGWPTGGIQDVATIAGVLSTAALGASAGLSYILGEKLMGPTSSALLAAPALVTSLALGFATTRITSKAVNRLRIAALFVALLGVASGVTLSVLGGHKSSLNTLHGLLIAFAVLSFLVTAGYPGRAKLRERARVPLAVET